MRILHIGKFFPPEPGGIERFTANLATVQARAGLDVSVLAHCPQRSAIEPLDVGGERAVTVYRARSYGRMLFAPVSPRWPLQLGRALREQRPDLLHLQLPNASALALLASPAARRIPWVAHWHADVPADSPHPGLRLAYPAYRHFERLLLQRVSAIVTTSPQYLQASPALQPFAARAVVIPLGIGAAPEPGRAPEWPAGGMRLLAVGRLSFYKGFEYLLEALAQVSGASLLLIGNGEQRERLQAQIARLGLQDRVRMVGGVDDPALEAAYRACDALCLPSIDRSEAFGLVLAEAMRAGRPTIATSIPGSGVSSVVADGETGLLVPPRDVPALAAAIRSLAADPALRQRLGDAGREHWHRRLRIEPVAEQVTALYRKVLA